MVLFLPLDEYQGFHNRSQVRMDEIKMSMLNSRNKFHFDEIHSPSSEVNNDCNETQLQ